MTGLGPQIQDEDGLDEAVMVSLLHGEQGFLFTYVEHRVRRRRFSHVAHFAEDVYTQKI